MVRVTLVTLGLTWLAGGQVAGLLGLARAGPAGAVVGEEGGHEDLGQERGEGEVGLLRGESRHSGGRGGQGVREADLVRGDARRVRGDPGEPADGLVDGEQRPHLLHDALGVAGAQDGLALAHVGLVVADDCLAAQRKGYAQARSSAGYSSTSSRSVTRQNTSEVCSPPSSAVVCTVYSMTQTVTGGPSFFRGGFSSARYVPSARTCTGLRVNDAEARHRRCAPVARTARAAAQDKNLRSASTSMPGPKQPSRSAASDSAVPICGRSRLCTPNTTL